MTFLHVGHQPWVTKMVESALALGLEPVQLTDTKTAAVPGVRTVIRRNWDGKHLMKFRMQHLADIKDPHLTVDADVIFKANVDDVWADDFDVALTYRTQPLTLTKDWHGESKGSDLSISMPINTGVMFSRNAAFWEGCLEFMEYLPEEKLNWWGDQMAVNHMAQSDSFKVKRLSCDEFNWTPSSPDHYEGSRIVHYKGTRKSWLA